MTELLEPAATLALFVFTVRAFRSPRENPRRTQSANVTVFGLLFVVSFEFGLGVELSQQFVLVLALAKSWSAFARRVLLLLLLLVLLIHCNFVGSR